MIASQPAACNDLRRQTVSAEPSSGPSEIIVANYASPTFRLYIALLNKAIVTPIATEVVTDPPFVSSPAEFSPTESSPFQSPPSESSPSVHLTSESSPLASSPLHVWPSVSSPQQSSRGLADPLIRRTCSMPNIRVRFCADGIRHVSSPQRSSRGFTDPPRRTCSMPNVHVRFCSSRDFSELADVETGVRAASLLRDVPEDRRRNETEPATEPAAERPKRRTLWKRTKRFVRRLFCCA